MQAAEAGIDAPELLLDLAQARGQVQDALLRLLCARVLDVRKAQHSRRPVRKHRHIHLRAGIISQNLLVVILRLPSIQVQAMPHSCVQDANTDPIGRTDIASAKDITCRAHEYVRELFAG